MISLELAQKIDDFFRYYMVVNERAQEEQREEGERLLRELRVAILAEQRRQTEGTEVVSIPKSANHAVLMVGMGLDWLRSNDPKRLAQQQIVAVNMRAVWRAALTLANNICVAVSDRANEDDESTERIQTASECAKKIKEWIEPDEVIEAEINSLGNSVYHLTKEDLKDLEAAVHWVENCPFENALVFAGVLKKLVERLQKDETQALETAISNVGTDQGKKALENYLKLIPFPHYRPHPTEVGVLIRTEEDGKETVGRFVDRKFIVE